MRIEYTIMPVYQHVTLPAAGDVADSSLSWHDSYSSEPDKTLMLSVNMDDIDEAR